jgi:hypothetical protein
MPVSINNTTLTFNDATTQTTAGLVSGGALGTPSSGTLTNCTSVPVNQATGTLPVANGGTGASTLTANNVLLGNGTSALQVVAPGSNGNILTSNGSTWTSAAPAGGGVTSLNGQTGAITDTTFNVIGSYTGGCPNATGTISAGATLAGSSIQQATYGRSGCFNGVQSSAPFGNQGQTGTWRAMGRSNGENDEGTNYVGGNLWVRIS